MCGRLRSEARARVIPAAWAVFLGLGILATPVLIAVEPAFSHLGWQVSVVVTAMGILTWLGYGGLDIGIFVVTAILGWCSGRREVSRRGVIAALTVSGAGLLGQLVKNIACRARPSAPLAGTFFAHFPCFPAKYADASFPSGHVITAFAAAVFLALWYPCARWVFLILATLVALSRIVLGAHFPSDALAGALIGSGSALLVHTLVPAVRRSEA